MTDTVGVLRPASDVLQDPGSDASKYIIDNFPSFELNPIQRVLRTPTVQCARLYFFCLAYLVILY
jgi:hypothetical protein